MKHQLFAELRHSLGEALDHAQGKRELRTTQLPARPRALVATDVRRIRDSVNASQAVFASYLNVSPQLVRAWEAGRRRPDGAALRLLEVAALYPQAVFGDLAPKRVVREAASPRPRRAPTRPPTAAKRPKAR